MLVISSEPLLPSSDLHCLLKSPLSRGRCPLRLEFLSAFQDCHCEMAGSAPGAEAHVEVRGAAVAAPAAAVAALGLSME